MKSHVKIPSARMCLYVLLFTVVTGVANGYTCSKLMSILRRAEASKGSEGIKPKEIDSFNGETIIVDTSSWSLTDPIPENAGNKNDLLPLIYNQLLNMLGPNGVRLEGRRFKFNLDLIAAQTEDIQTAIAAIIEATTTAQSAIDGEDSNETTISNFIRQIRAPIESLVRSSTELPLVQHVKKKLVDGEWSEHESWQDVAFVGQGDSQSLVPKEERPQISRAVYRKDNVSIAYSYDHTYSPPRKVRIEVIQAYRLPGEDTNGTPHLLVFAWNLKADQQDLSLEDSLEEGNTIRTNESCLATCHSGFKSDHPAYLKHGSAVSNKVINQDLDPYAFRNITN